MIRSFPIRKLGELWSRVSCLILIAAAVACVSLLSTDHAGALYILTGASDAAIVLDEQADREAVRDFSSQLVYVDTRTGGYEVTLESKLPVTVRYNGGTVETVSRRETISFLLSRLKIEPSPLDMVLVDLSNGSGVELTIGSDLTYYDRDVEFISYETIRTETPTLPAGTEEVVQEGRDGVRAAVYEVVYSNGEMVSRQLVAEEDSTAVPKRILVGTGSPDVAAVPSAVPSAAPVAEPQEGDRLTNVSKNADGSGTLTFASGKTLEFSAVKSMTATAYTTGYDGVDLVTATGTIVSVGTVAVDKTVIPLGTRMYIVTEDGAVDYGLAVAADTGVRGNKIDLYYDTYEQCINFGRRTATVYLLR